MTAKRTASRCIALLLALLLLVPVSSASADTTNDRMPTRIVSNIKKGSPTMVQSFTWWTREKVEDPILLITLTDTFTTANTYEATVEEVQSTVLERNAQGEALFENTKTGAVFTAKDRPSGWMPSGDERAKTRVITEYVYKAEAFTLFPNMTYYYRVGSRSNPSLQSTVGRFSTSTLAGEPFRFLHISDTQTSAWNDAEARASADAFAAMLRTVPDAGFVLHGGNVTQSADWEDGWQSLFSWAQKSFSTISTVPVPGPLDRSAEAGDTAWHRHFTVPAAQPEEASYYYVDYNNARLFVLDTNDAGAQKGYLSPKQIDWMKRNIEAAKKQDVEWIFVAMHESLYGLSHRMGDPKIDAMHASMMELFQSLGVDLVLGGGERQYLRTKPLAYADNAAYAAPSEKDGTTFVVPGAFGKVAYDALLERPLEKVQSVLPHAGMTQAALDTYRNLIGASLQPNPSSAENKENVARDATTQTFTSFAVSGRVLKGTAYRVKNGEAVAFDTFIVDKDNPKAQPDPLPTPQPNGKPTVERISGSDRYATAADTVRHSFSRSEIALLASGDAYPDSLAASGLAGALKAPILLVPKSGVPQSVFKELERIGVKKVFLIGGEASVTPAVAAALTGYQTERIAGKDRYETGRLIADRVAQITGGAQALVASGEDFPDALALSGVAAARRAPVVLTPKSTLHAQALAYLEKIRPTSALVAGGEGTLSASVFHAVAERIAHTDRVSGANRYQTSLAIAKWSFPHADTVVIASGEGFADALVAANLSARYDAPILLSSAKGLEAEVRWWIQNGDVDRIFVVGGEGTLPDSVVSVFR